MPEHSSSPNFNRNPVLWLASFFAFGILSANLFNIDFKYSLAMCAFCAVTALAFGRQRIGLFLILLAFAAAGMSSALIEKQSISPNRLKILYDSGALRSGDPVYIEGVLLGPPEPSNDRVTLDLDVKKLTHHGTYQIVSGNVRLYLPASQPETETVYGIDIASLKYGSRLRIDCKLEREDEFLNPGVVSKREILDRMEIDAVGSIKSGMLIEKIADESVFLPLAWVYDQRANLIGDFKNNLSSPVAGVMIASLLGDKNFLDKNTSDLFREGGTFHILVISGLHITFIGGLLLLFLRQLTRNRWTQFLVTIVVLWAYTLAVGADLPVVRAAIMFTVVLYSYVIYRQVSLLNSLGLCALILLVWRPSDLLNPSFQLTFVSVAAIITFAYPLIDLLRQIGTWTPTARSPFPPNVPFWLKRFCETLYWNEDVWAFEAKRQIWSANLFKSPILANRAGQPTQYAIRFLFEGLFVSLIVQICMLPLTIVYFHRVSVISVLLNIWVGLFIALESFAAVIGVVVNRFSGLLADGFFMFAEIFNWLMLLLPRLFADHSWASFRLPAYSGYGRVIYILYFLPIIFLGFALYWWRPFDLKNRSWVNRRFVVYPALMCMAALIFLVVFHPFSSPRADGRLHIDFLDVGQGDAAFITFPDGRTLLVDGGGRVKYKDANDENETFERDVRGIGESIVSEFLWHRGYSRIDYILATHADADHIQGLTDVAKNFEIGAAIFGRTPIEDPDFAALAGVLLRRGIPVEIVARGETLKFDEVLVEVLYPPASDDAGAVSDNDNSVVLRIIYGSRSFLLTGDIESAAENRILAGKVDLKSDLIKVAHHGSRTSSTQQFIDAVDAKQAIISVGRSSPFGHPHKEIVERWKAHGTKLRTTGEKGTVSVSTDGKSLEIKTFLE